MRRLIVVMALVLPSAAWALPGRALAKEGRAEVVEIVRRDTAVHERPGPAKQRGTLAVGAHFKVKARRSGAGCKRGEWLEIGEDAWVCSLSTREADRAGKNPDLPVVPKGQLLPHDTYVLTEDPWLYKSEEDIDKGRRSRFAGKHSFELLGKLSRGGKPYVKVSIGYLPSEQVTIAAPSERAGVQIDADVRLPFVFAHLHGGAELRDNQGQPVRETLPRWSRLELLGELTLGQGKQKTRHYRVRKDADGPERLVVASQVRAVHLAEPPKDLGKQGAEARWVDVDLKNQVMVAYVGKRPVLATLVSTARTTTPAGTFRIYKKRANTPLRSRPTARQKYWMETPWVMTIRGSIAIHTSYWHDDFGIPKSHGCVNLTPADARWLWDWSEPRLPAGWASIDRSPGTVVRIRR